MEKQVIVADERGRSFARSLRVGPFLFISGMTGQWDMTTWEFDERSRGDVEYQVRRIYEWMAQVLAVSDLTLDAVVKTTTFLRSMEYMPILRKVNAEMFPKHDHASTTVAVADFVYTADVEIEAIALFPEGK